jgi:hypothetical protein
MQMIENQTFRDQAVEVDGKQFQRCVFQNARLDYAGGALPVFIDCKFSNVSLGFAEGAANTIAFLSGLQGRGFEVAVSKLTAAIREHKF